MFKNLTIRQITNYLSFTIWVFNLAFFFLFVFWFEVAVPMSYLFGYAILSLILTYLVVRLLSENFIFRKIKVIYKIISQSKDSMTGVVGPSGNNSSLEAVNDRVIEWAEETEKELTNMKSLENYRRDYIGNVSHELKTPIFSIQGYLHTLLDGGLNDERINRKYVERAYKNTERIQTIIEDLEVIAKFESQFNELDLKPFDIKSLVEEVFKDLELVAKDKNTKMFFKPGADYNYKVYADMEQIRQVFVNLISNSIKYGIDNGVTKVSFYDMEKSILIEVSDNGIGIKPEDINHVFDRFYRVDKSRSRDVGGSGLGLSIVKHIVDAHNEKLTLRSTIGEGSTFGFTLKKHK